MRNLITDVEGLSVGNAHDARVASGVTVVVFDRPAAASVAILGGGPGTRDTSLLEPEMTVEAIDALVLSGGSAFGLDAAGGVMAVLAERGRGFRVRDVTVPIVPQAILFDLVNGGDKGWGRKPPYFDLGMAACEAAAASFALGTAGAGYGATTSTLKGGLGSASQRTRSGTHGRRACRRQRRRDRHHRRRSALLGGADGARRRVRRPRLAPSDAGGRPRAALKGGPPGQNTTIAVVATDAILTKAQCKRIANAAHDGYARALRPAHTPLDGDLVFAAATGLRPLQDPAYGLAELAMAAADCLARAVARGVHAATALPFPDAQPAWRDRFGG